MNTKVLTKISTQLVRLFPIIIKLYTPILILLLLVVFISFKTGISIGVFTSDPALIAGDNGLSSLVNATTNPFVGVVSNIGILFWCISASICFFSFAILQKIQKIDSKRWSNLSYFLFFSGLITSILLLDDLFLVHESIVPKLLNISQKVTYSFYAAAIFCWILRFRKTIFKTEWKILFLAFLFFGFSMVMDEFIPSISIYLTGLSEQDSQFLFEDGFKLFGIVSWLAYFVRVCFQVVNNAIEGEVNAVRQQNNVTVQIGK